MAIQHQPREDLMRDATAYVRRACFTMSDAAGPVFVGLRRSGSWSIYFGEDPVYQFDSENKLRRVHFQSQNFAADAGKLVRLQRDRGGGRVELTRVYCEESERTIVSACLSQVKQAAATLAVPPAAGTRIFPVDDGELLKQVAAMLNSVAQNIRIAEDANA